MKNRIITITFFVGTAITLISLLVLVFVADPLQLFNKHSDNKLLVGNMRQQAAGVINQYKFDSIVLGTSMLENTSSKEASNILGGNFTNISLSGSDFHTRSIVLKYALKNKEIKRVLYSLDGNVLTGSSISNTSNFDYLYDDNKLNDLKAYINPKYLLCSVYSSFCLLDVEVERPNAWYKNIEDSKRFGGLDNWFKAKNNSQIKAAFESILTSIESIKQGKVSIDKNLKQNIEKSHNYIDSTILEFVSKYPQTEFLLVIPPYSRISYAIDAQYNVSKFKHFKDSVKYLVAKSAKYKNLKIYGWGNHSFVDNISNYKDLGHYEYKINTFMLNAIKKEEGRLTTENIDNYLDVFTKKALGYDLIQIGNKIDKYLNPQ